MPGDNHSSYKNIDNKEMEKKIIVIGCMDNTQDHTFEIANRVYDKHYIAPTVNTCGGVIYNPKSLKDGKEH